MEKNVSVKLNSDELCKIVMKWAEENTENRACIFLCKENQELTNMLLGRGDILVNIIVNALRKNQEFKELLIHALEIELSSTIR